MPFTPAHPAIVLPFINKRYFSATGLIMGSMSPDFEYFFKASVSGIHGHTLAGLFYFDLPVSIFFAIIFHHLIKGSFIANLPVFLQSRAQPVLKLNFRKYLKENGFVFGVSALVGAASHIFWDGFTHNGRFFVEFFPTIKGTIIPFQGARYPLWYILQHVSTWVGITILLIYTYFLPPTEVKSPNPKISYWVWLTLISGLFFAARFTLFSARFDLGNAVVTSISSLILTVCLISFIPYFKPAALKS